jgi:hypothetical protein
MKLMIIRNGTYDYFEGVQKEFCSRRIHKQQQTTNDHVNDDGDDNEDYYQLWPLDKLRLELEEIWPGGAGLAREDDGAKKLTTEGQQQRRRPFGGGLPRSPHGCCCCCNFFIGVHLKSNTIIIVVVILLHCTKFIN